MKFRLFCLIFSAICAMAQPQPDSRPDIRELVELSGGLDGIDEVFKPEAIEAQMRSVLKPENAPPAQRPKVERFIAEFAKEFSVEAKQRRQELLDLTVSIYAKYYTPEDVKALVAFFQSPAGKKLAVVGRKAMMESMQTGQKWGQQLGEQIVKRVGQRIEAEEAGAKKP